MPELTVTSPNVDTNTCLPLANPMPETLTLCQSRLYLPVRRLGFGLMSHLLPCVVVLILDWLSRLLKARLNTLFSRCIYTVFAKGKYTEIQYIPPPQDPDAGTQVWALYFLDGTSYSYLFLGVMCIKDKESQKPKPLRNFILTLQRPLPLSFCVGVYTLRYFDLSLTLGRPPLYCLILVCVSQHGRPESPIIRET